MKFHPFGYLVMVEDGKKTFRFRQSKDNNSFVSNVTLMELHVHNQTIVIYIQYKFQDNPFIDYQDVDEDGNNQIWEIKGR